MESSAIVANLREIARALSAAWDVHSTLDLIARRTTQVMQVDSCSIYLLDESDNTLWLRASTGLSAKAVGRGRLALGEGLTGWAAQHSQPVAAPNAQSDPRFKFVPYTNERAFQSLLAVPLINRQRVIGAMNVQTLRPRAFTPDEIELLTLISDLAAGAIDRALLHDHMQRQLTELSTLAQVSQTVNSPLYLDDMLDVVAGMAAKVLGTPRCVLRLLDDATGELRLVAGTNLSPAYRAERPLRAGEGIAGLVLASGQPLAVDDVRVDPRYHYRDLAISDGLVSMLAVPLMVRGRVRGVFTAYTLAPHHFNHDEMALFTTLANQVALAIENAQLATHAAIIREMHHRIRNNLQTVALLLRMQANESAHLSAQDVLLTSVNRIQSIAAVHDTLAQEGYRLVNVREVLERVTHLTLQNMVSPGLNIRLQMEGPPLTLPSRAATALALIVNELTQNALEHAFVGRTRGQLRIRWAERARHIHLEVSDDGVGLPADADPFNSLGLTIVATLAREDLRGKIDFKRARAGTTVSLRFPRPKFDSPTL